MLRCLFDACLATCVDNDKVLGLVVVISTCLFIWLLYATSSKKIHSKKLLILDMNNVLVYRAFKYAQEAEQPETVQYNGSATLLGGKFWTWKRPHLNAFLDYCFANFTVAVWSSARGENVTDLVDFVFNEDQKRQLLFLWDQSRCTTLRAEVKPQFFKELAHVWIAYPQYNEDNTILVDDSEQKMSRNPRKTWGLIQAWTFGNGKRPEDDLELENIIKEKRFFY